LSDNLLTFLKTSGEYDSIELQKLTIGSIIQEKMKEQKLSYQKLSDNIEGMGPAQVSRVLYGENYNIMTLLKILDFFDLELEVKKK
jgi:hypothetical protein